MLNYTNREQTNNEVNMKSDITKIIVTKCQQMDDDTINYELVPLYCALCEEYPDAEVIVGITSHGGKLYADGGDDWDNHLLDKFVEDFLAEY